MNEIDTRPIAYDICCGLGGWTEALLDEGYRVIGFDVEAHDYGTGGYPGELRLRDITTIHGSELKDAALIVCSPPCQRYSYMAMPWSRAKAQAAMIEADTTGEEMRKLNLLFDTCFRLQREASEAAGHHIPMIVENVRGAQKWVGRAAYHYGSFYLWGDVPALMPVVQSRKMKTTGPVDAAQSENHNCHINEMRDHMKNPGGGSWDRSRPSHTDDHSWDSGVKVGNASARTFTERRQIAADNPGLDPHNFWHNQREDGRKADGSGWTEKGSLASHNRLVSNQRPEGLKGPGGDWFKDGRQGQDACSEGIKVAGISLSAGKSVGFNGTAAQRYREGVKQTGISGPRENGKGDKWFQDGAAKHGSRSNSRKAASAMIAKIPYPLAQHIARTFKPG